MQSKGIDRLLSVNTRQAYFLKKAEMMKRCLIISSRSCRKYMTELEMSLSCAVTALSLFKTLPYSLGNEHRSSHANALINDTRQFNSYQLSFVSSMSGVRHLTHKNISCLKVVQDGTGQIVCSDTRPFFHISVPIAFHSFS